MDTADGFFRFFLSLAGNLVHGLTGGWGAECRLELLPWFVSVLCKKKEVGRVVLIFWDGLTRSWKN